MKYKIFLFVFYLTKQETVSKTYYKKWKLIEMTNTEKTTVDASSQENHMHGLERIKLDITDISKPFPNLMRLKGTIDPSKPDLWEQPNVAVRIEIGENAGKNKIYRIYTIRSFDKKSKMVELDFVIHEGHSPAKEWLKSQNAGSSVYIIGPREQFFPHEHKNGKLKFFADETAIPALYSILQHWPENAEADMFIECPSPLSIRELPEISGVKKHVYVRKPHEHAGMTGFLTKSAEKIKEAKNCHIWIACEREEARAIRKHFLENCGVNKKDIKAIGYWRLGMTSSEIEKIRGKYYGELLAKGKSESDFDEFDMPA